MKEVLKEIVYQKGLEVLLTRMEALLRSYELKKLAYPTVVSASITDKDAVIAKIKETWTCFTITDVSININRQVVEFGIYGSCWVPYDNRDFIPTEWSEFQTEECNYHNVITKANTQTCSMPLRDFIDNGVTGKIVLY